MPRRGKVIPDSLWQALPALPENWLGQLRAELAWTPEMAAKLDLRLWASPNGEERVALPIRDRALRLLNIRLLKPLADQYEAVNFRHGQGEGQVHYGGLRLFPHPQAWPVHDLHTCWIVASEVECVTALGQGMFAVCVTGPAGAWSKAFAQHFQGLRVAVCFPDDKQSQDKARSLALALGSQPQEVRLLDWQDTFTEGAIRESGWGLGQFFTRAGGNLGLLDLLLEESEVIWREPEKGTSDAQGTQVGQASLVRLKAFSDLDDKTTFRPLLLAHEILGENHLATDRVSGLTYRFNGQVWRPVTGDDLRNLVVAKLGLASSRNKLTEVVELVRAKAILPDGQELDSDPNHLCVANGMLDLDTGRLSPHAPQYLCTFMFPWDWTPHDPPDCQRVKQFFLETIQVPEVIAEVQEFAGYCLWPGQQYKKALLLIGPGDDGKSKLLELLRQLVGAENTASVNLADLEDQFQRVMLHNKALNICGEASANFFSNEVFKRITGGDPISAAYKHVDSFSFNTRAKLAFAANDFPRVKDTSEAFYDRILPVRFRRRFVEGDPARDPHLMDKLRAEMPGLFHWAMVGLFRLRRRGGFQLSETSKAYLNQYRYANNHVLAFVEDCCLLGKDAYKEPHEVSRDDLYAAYASWAKANGYKPKPSNTFKGMIPRLCPEVESYRPAKAPGAKTRPPYHFRGIGLVQALGPAPR